MPPSVHLIASAQAVPGPDRRDRDWHIRPGPHPVQLPFFKRVPLIPRSVVVAFHLFGQRRRWFCRDCESSMGAKGRVQVYRRRPMAIS